MTEITETEERQYRRIKSIKELMSLSKENVYDSHVQTDCEGDVELTGRVRGVTPEREADTAFAIAHGLSPERPHTKKIYGHLEKEEVLIPFSANIVATDQERVVSLLTACSEAGLEATVRGFYSRRFDAGYLELHQLEAGMNKRYFSRGRFSRGRK